MHNSGSETPESEYGSGSEFDFLACRLRPRASAADEEHAERSTGKWKKSQMMKAEQDMAEHLEHILSDDITDMVFEHLDTVEQVAESSNIKGDIAKKMHKAVVFIRAAMTVMSKRTQAEVDILYLKSQNKKLEGKLEEQAALLQQVQLEMNRMKSHLPNGSGAEAKIAEPSERNGASHGEMDEEPVASGSASHVRSAPKAPEDPNSEDPLGESASRSRIPRRAPRGAVIMMYIDKANSSEDYRDAMRLAQQRLNLSDFGIDGLRMRTARNGAYVLEVRGENKQEKADRLASALREVLTDRGATISRPQKWGELKLSNVDENATDAQIKTELSAAGKCSPLDIHTTPIIKLRRGKSITWVKCPLEAAITVARKEKIKVGRSFCKVELLKAQPQRCYKCFKEGHITSQCTEAIDDFTRVCHRCGEEGHISRDCRNSLSCKACRDAGHEYRHRIGSERCMTRGPRMNIAYVRAL